MLKEKKKHPYKKGVARRTLNSKKGTFFEIIL